MKINRQNKDSILEDLKPKLKHSLDIEFKKDYYMERGTTELKKMYHFSLKKDYFISDRADVLKAAIKDLEKELRLLELIDEGQDKARESWESVSK